MNKRPPDLPAANQDGVSILKPLKGIDPSLEGNLETFFNLDYPKVSWYMMMLFAMTVVYWFKPTGI